jgi:hypothetical protein
MTSALGRIASPLVVNLRGGDVAMAEQNNVCERIEIG